MSALNNLSLVSALGKLWRSPTLQLLFSIATTRCFSEEKKNQALKRGEWWLISDHLHV